MGVELPDCPAPAVAVVLCLMGSGGGRRSFEADDLYDDEPLEERWPLLSLCLLRWLPLPVLPVDELGLPTSVMGAEAPADEDFRYDEGVEAV